MAASPLKPYQVALVVTLGSWLSTADLPVHCLRHQVAGEWEFTLSQVGPKRNSCGHLKPDSQDHQPPINFVQNMHPHEPAIVKKISLKNPNTASTDDGSTGTWTMIYDEGFEVQVGDHTYFAFSKFEMVNSPHGRTNVSHCDQTEVGWYHNKARDQWGCYVGRKIEAHAESKPMISPPTALISWLSTTDKSKPRMSRATKDPLGLGNVAQLLPGNSAYDKPMADDFQQNIADALNFLQLGWTASSYDMFMGKTPREMNRYAGVRRHRVQHSQQRQSATELSFLSVSSKVRHASVDSLDWRSKDGQSWITPVVEQGDCGSCYTISTVHMLTARNRIRSGSTAEPSFSVSFPLYCAEYNQGCDGGYGFLQTKWSEDVGLVPEKCNPFNQGGGSCSATKNCDLGAKRYRATNHHYVGGFYGGSDADAIRQELMQGPLVMSFEPQEDFMYYKTGIYRSGPHKIHQEWEQVDHAVLLIGFGAEKDQAFWSLQNSWGTDWGEDGFFRMARGIDESGCESIVVSADVVEEDENPILADFLTSL